MMRIKLARERGERMRTGGEAGGRMRGKRGKSKVRIKIRR